METCRCKSGFRDDPDIFSKLNSAYKLKRRELNSVLSKSSENDENVKIFMKTLEKKLTEKYYQVGVLEFSRLLTGFIRRHRLRRAWPTYRGQGQGHACHGQTSGVANLVMKNVGKLEGVAN